MNGLVEFLLVIMVEGIEGYFGLDICIVCKEVVMCFLWCVMVVLEKRDFDCDDFLF